MSTCTNIGIYIGEGDKDIAAWFNLLQRSGQSRARWVRALMAANAMGKPLKIGIVDARAPLIRDGPKKGDYVELQELESTPVVLFDPSSGHDSRAYREHSLLAPAWYSVTQQARSPENGASCYASQLEAMYFRLLLPSMARSVAQAQMEQYRLVNLSWSYETLEHPGLDFVLLAREPEGLWQMAALGRGGQVAVFLYCGQEQLRDHLDLLSSWGR